MEGTYKRQSKTINPLKAINTVEKVFDNFNKRYIVRYRTILSLEVTRPGSNCSIRQESELMDQLREVEESNARDLWKNIVQFCKNTSYLSRKKTNAG